MMHRGMSVGVVVGMLLGGGAAVAQVGGGGDAGPRFVERPGQLEFTGRLLVRPKQATAWAADGLTAAQASQRRTEALARLAPDQVSHRPGPDRFVINVPAGEDENSYARKLMETGLYEYAAPDWTCYPAVPPVVPNDPDFASQYEHVLMRTAEAWILAPGETDIICAFCDSGVDTDHADLQASLVPGYNSVDNLPQANGGNVEDQNGHGTGVAGCIGAIANNGAGGAGAGYNFKLMPIRVSNNPGGGASLGAILGGAEWAAENGALTVSASFTGVQSPAVGTTGTYIKSLGSLFFYAADNFNQNHSGFDWEDTIVVGATDSADNKAGFSSYGVALDVFAPGVDVWSTHNGGGWGFFGGTSAATPIANGVTALIWSMDLSMTPDQVEALLFETCKDLGLPGDDSTFGHGRIDAFAGVVAAAGLNAGPTPPVGVDDFGSAVEGVPLDIFALDNDFDINGDFITVGSSDAVSANGGDVQYVPPFLGEERFIYTAPEGFGGTDTFTYILEDETDLLSDPITVTLDVLSFESFRDPDFVATPSPGVDTSYYSLPGGASVLPDFDTLEPFASEVLDNVNFPSTNGEFINSGLADNVGAVFEGFFVATETAEYTFYTNSDDGSRLYIGEELVVDNDGLHGMLEKSGTIALKQGLHQIRVEFFENGGGAGIIVSRESWNQPKEVIPTTQWRIDLGVPSCAPDVSGDGFIDSTDLNMVLSAFGTANEEADVTGDGFVDSADLNEVLVAFGNGC